MPSLNTDMAETNAIYVNPNDATTPFVVMGRFIYKCIPHPDVKPGTVCMNAIARRAVYPNEEVTLEEHFVPMTGGPSRICVQAEYVKRISDPMPQNLANIILNLLEGNIVMPGQKLTMTQEGHAILINVVTVDAPGIVTAKTEVILM